MKNHREREFEDYLNDAEVKDFLERAKREMFSKMKSSALVMSLYTGSIDPKLCLETGAAVLFNKPIIALAVKGSKVPPGLARIAHRVIEVDDITSPDAQEKIQQAIQQALDQIKADGD